jgi:hypothetical protein
MRQFASCMPRFETLPCGAIRLTSWRWRLQCRDETPLQNGRVDRGRGSLAATAWEPQPTPDTLMAIRDGVDERTLQQQVRQAGGRWDPQRKAWSLRIYAV